MYGGFALLDLLIFCMSQKTVKRGIGYISWGQTIHEVNIGGQTSLSIFTTIFAKLKPVLAAGGRNHSLMSLNDLLDTFSRAHAKISYTMRLSLLQHHDSFQVPLELIRNSDFDYQEYSEQWVSSKAATHKATGSNTFRTLVIMRFGVFYKCIKTVSY